MKKFVYIILLITIPFLSDAQRWKHERFSAFVGVGNSYFLGDLGGGSKDASHYLSIRDIDWNLTRPATQAGVAFRIIQDLTVKANFTYARLKADDAESGSLGRQSRNLHFRSDIYEIGTQLEYYFIKEKHVGRYTFSSFKGINRLSAYASLGGGVFFYNPKAELIKGDNNWQELRPLENEGVSYETYAGYLSIGVGLKYNLTDRWAIGLDISNRYTTTDFLDDAHDTYIGIDNGFADRHYDIDYDTGTLVASSGIYPAGKTRRGDPNYNDAYMFTMITGYFKISSIFSMPKY